MDLPKFSYFLLVLILFLVTGNEVANADLSLPKEQIITSLQDGRLNLNDSLSIEDVQLSHGLINLHNLNTLSTLDFEFDDALEDIHILNAVANSINEWKLRKHAKNASSNGVNKKRVKRDEEVVCYRNLGCFKDEGPFDYLDTLPVSPDVINTTFTLFTREQKNGEPLEYQNITTITSSKISNERPIKIIIHGFGSSGRRPWVVQMTEALIYIEDVNVIVVDWEAGAALPNYVQAAANTQLVGKQIANLIKVINQNLNFEPKDYHLIGFSLGAHIAGFAGSEIKNISRITGLDPASPLFEGYTIRARLDPSDAIFVDVIHSNGDSFLKGGLGSFSAMGHIDYYPNGGRFQVGCNSVFMGALTDILYGKWQSLCHHRRAFRFFIDSLVPSCRFHSFACDSYENFLKGECFSCGESGRRCANMGYYASNSNGEKGKYYLMTRNKEPFCANQYKIRILSSNNGHSTWGKLEISFISKDANETFPLTAESDEIKDKAILQGLVVAHPIIRNITHVLLRYTKWRGWLYWGKEFWAVDKIILQNSDGEIFSYCGFNTIIQTNESVLLNLERKNCTLHEPSTDLPTARVARLIWGIVSKPIRPPNFLWRLSDYNPIQFNYHLNGNTLPASAQTALANYNNFNLATGPYSLNPNLINTNPNQKPAFSTYSTMNSLNSNQNTNLASNANLMNLNMMKANTFRYMIRPTAITTTTSSHPDGFFKLNNMANERLTSAPIGPMQNELEFNEMPKVPQPIALSPNNVNTLNNLNNLNNLNSNLNANMNPNLSSNLNQNPGLPANLNISPAVNLEDVDRPLGNSSQLTTPNLLNSTFPLSTSLSTQNATLVQ